MSATDAACTARTPRWHLRRHLIRLLPSLPDRRIRTPGTSNAMMRGPTMSTTVSTTRSTEHDAWSVIDGPPHPTARASGNGRPHCASHGRRGRKDGARGLACFAPTLAALEVDFGGLAIAGRQSGGGGVPTAVRSKGAVASTALAAWGVCVVRCALCAVQHHIQALAKTGTENSVFLRLVHTLHEGLASSDEAVVTECAAAMEHIATFLFRHQRGGSEPPSISVAALQQHLNRQPELFTKMLQSLFHVLLFSPVGAAKLLGGPILATALASPQSWAACQRTMVASQPPDLRPQLQRSLEALFANVSANIGSAVCAEESGCGVMAPV